jgi:branched-chain amino acid aminotransferase
VNGLQAWVQDGLVPAAAATVSVYDRGLRSGEGVFETIRAYQGHPFRLDAHVARAVIGATALGFDLTASALSAAVRATAEANDPLFAPADHVVRLTATAGALDPSSPFPGVPVGPATLIVTSQPLPGTAGQPSTARCVAALRSLPEVKSTSYVANVVARRRAQEAGADEALLVDPDGQILEGAGTNVFAVVDDVLVTPPVSAGLLDGVTRTVVLGLAAQVGTPTCTRPLSRDELLDASEAFLTSSVREVVPLTAVDGRVIGDGSSGACTRMLQTAYRAEVAREQAEALGRR